MMWAEMIPQEAKELGNLGVTGLMSVGLFTFAAVIVWIFRTWRADMGKAEVRLDAKEAKYDEDKKEMRAEYTAALTKITDAVQAVAAEARAATVESRAATVTILARLDRIEDHIDAQQPVR